MPCDASLVYCRSEQIVSKNNAKLKAAKAAAGADVSAVPEVADSSLTKARVAIIAPCRHVAFRCVKALLDLHGERTAQMKPFLGRFSEEFGPDEEEEGRPVRANGLPYPEDFTFTFTGNTDDNFSIGLKLSRKSAKLFSKLQFSDVIIASPLAVRMLVGEHGKGADCLASVEIAVILGMEMLHMQNWEHLVTTMAAMNQTPASDHGTDFSRVRPFCLNGTHLSARLHIYHWAVWWCASPYVRVR
jgi:U3 small nucleolar RNA-associated protein 25